MAGGALCAAATTLNGLIGSVPIPLVMLSHYGWLPKSLGTLHPKHKTAYKYLFIYYIITMAPLFLGVDISAVTDMTLLGSYVQTAIFIFNMRKIPEMFPEVGQIHLPYAQGRVQRGHVDLLYWCRFQCYRPDHQLRLEDDPGFNVAIMAIGIIYSLVWFKSGKVHPTVSYELEG